MHPTICQIGPFTIYSYGLLLAVAFMAGTFLASHEAKRIKLDPRVVFNFSFLALITGVIGARLFYVVENFEFYRHNPGEIFLLQHGGLSWFGGFFLAGTCAFIYFKKQRLPALAYLDLIAPYLSLGQAVGRIGCLLNGCCFGRETLLVPAQVISSGLLLGIYFILRRLQLKAHLSGTVFLAYLVLYSLKRFFIEFIRIDNPKVFFGLTLFQILSVGLFCAALCGLYLVRKKRPR